MSLAIDMATSARAPSIRCSRAYLGGHASAWLPARVLMVLFGAMMSVTAVVMLCGRRLLAMIASGSLGAGGGFRIVPALGLFSGLAMPSAIGTSQELSWPGRLPGTHARPAPATHA